MQALEVEKQKAATEPYMLQRVFVHGEHEYDEVRRARAQHRWALSSVGRVFLSYQDCNALLKDPHFHNSTMDVVRSQGIDSGPFYDWFSTILVCQTGHNHQRLRGLVQQAFRADRLEQIRAGARRGARAARRGTARYHGVHGRGRALAAYPGHLHDAWDPPGGRTPL